MHMQERVDSDVGRQSWEQSPLLTLQGLVPSWSGVRWEAERKGQWLSSGPRRQAHTPLPWTLWGSPPNPALRSSVLQGPWPLGGEQSLTHFHSHLLTCPGVPAAPPGHSPDLCDPHPTAPAPRPPPHPAGCSHRRPSCASPGWCCSAGPRSPSRRPCCTCPSSLTPDLPTTACPLWWQEGMRPWGRPRPQASPVSWPAWPTCSALVPAPPQWPSPMMARAVALPSWFRMASMTSSPLPSRLQRLMVWFLELIQ